MFQERIFSNITPLNVKLNPWFVTGFTDVDGSFEVYLVNRPQNSTGSLCIPLFLVFTFVKIESKNRRRKGPFQREI